KTPHLALGDGAEEGIDGPAAGESEDRRDRLDAKLAGDRGVLVDVDLDEPDLASLLVNHLLEIGGQLPAGPAPGRPEIDEYRGFEGGIDHVFLEGAVGRLLDERRRGGRVAAEGSGIEIHCRLS